MMLSTSTHIVSSSLEELDEVAALLRLKNKVVDGMFCYPHFKYSLTRAKSSMLHCNFYPEYLPNRSPPSVELILSALKGRPHKEPVVGGRPIPYDAWANK